MDVGSVFGGQANHWALFPGNHNGKNFDFGSK
jgi:hypothetical protein